MPPPATLVVMLLVGLLIVIGGLILGSARPRAPGDARRCARCGADNPTAAAYCGQCGQALRSG